jgi:hypothetical protein
VFGKGLTSAAKHGIIAIDYRVHRGYLGMRTRRGRRASGLFSLYFKVTFFLNK